MDNPGSQDSAMPSNYSPQLGHSTQSSMSLASSSTLLDDQDEDVRIAVKALGDMRNGNIGGTASKTVATPALSLSISSIPATSIPSPTLSSISNPSPSNDNVQSDSDFVSRMAHIPLVTGALRMYEQGKASSRVVKYGAEIMESGVKTISRPVIDRLPTSQLDDFACRQLNRLDRYRRPSQGASERQDQEEVRQALRSPTRVSQEGRDTQGRGDDVGRWVQTNMLSSEIGSSSSTPHYSSYSRERDDDWNSSSSRGGSLSGPIHFPDESSYNFGLDDQRKFPPSTYPQSFQRQGPEDNQQRQIVQRSRWQTMLLEAGGFSAAWSEESMRRLRYVLQWLQYATNRIDQQILTIRDFTESLQQHYFEAESTTSINDRTSSAKASGHSHSSSTSTQGLRSRPLSESQTQAISPTHMHKLTLIQHDVVQTIRTVVNVVSEHGGSAALPEPARNAMKGFILKLPKKVRDALRMGGPSSELQVGMERDSAVAAAASGRARSDRRTTARRGTRGDRGLGGSLSAAPSPMSSRANSPSASPRRMPTRGLHSSASSVSLDQDQGVSSSRHGPGHTVSAGTAIVAAQRILTLASESLDMMHGVTGVVKESLERADAWVERLKTLGVQRGDGPSNAQAGSGRPSSSSSTLASEIDSGRMTLNSDSSTMHFVHRDPETDSAPLSPLSVGLNPGRSRRESFGSSTGYNFPGGSLPSTPGLPTSYPSGMYGPNTFSYPGLDAPSPEVGLGLKRMSIRNEGDLVDVKLEEREAEMEVDG